MVDCLFVDANFQVRCNFRQLSIVNCQTKRKSISTKQFAKINAIRCFLWNTTITNNTGAVPQTAAITVIKSAFNAFNTKADDIPKNMPPANVYRQFMIEKISTNVNATSIFDRRILDFGTAVTSIVFKVSFCSSIEKSITRIMENKKGATRKLPNKIFIPTRLRKRYPLCKQSAKEKRM